MQLETLLPLGKVDPGLRAPDLPLNIWSIAADAALLEEIGYTGMAVEETKDDPFALLTIAALATTRLRLTTSVAIAFPRSPTVMALSAWTLQKLSRGRFTLGLGTQVRGHIQRRYGIAVAPGRGLDARIRPSRPGCVGLLAKRYPARFSGGALQPRPHGSVVQRRPHRSSRHPDSRRRGQHGIVFSRWGGR